MAEVPVGDSGGSTEGAERAMARVLIVDDDVVVRLLFALGIPEVSLLEASSFREGLELARANRPDAIIIDRYLPDGDGLDLVRQLRRHAATNRTPILVLTAGYDEADRLEVTRAGADDYVAKPFDPGQVIDRVQAILGLAPGARRERRITIVDRLEGGDERVIDLLLPSRAPAVEDAGSPAAAVDAADPGPSPPVDDPGGGGGGGGGAGLVGRLRRRRRR